MKTLALCLLLMAPVIAPAADFKTGLEAYNRGDFATALKTWQPIAEAGDPHAQYNLGLLYARGEGVPQDQQKAAEWYRKAADQGVAAAQYNLGVMYANGQGVARNPAEASKYFLAAAEHGVEGAIENLGRVYEESEGAFHNPAEAEKWYRRAAERGLASAMFNLGVMYDLGQGVSRNFEEAVKWYRMAADAGYAPALTNLGVLYYNGQGVKRDLAESYAWLARAQKLGDPRAAEIMKWTTKNMRPRDISRGKELAERWQPSQQARKQAETARLFRPAPETQAPAQPAAASVRDAAPVRTEPSGRQDTWTGVERVVAIGDVHGDYEQFVLALESAGLVDGYANWTGGKTHLVQTGDISGRGPDSRAVMDLLMKLEQQASAAGGAVHVLLGNHEAMLLYGDLRYVSPAEFAAFVSDPNSADRVTGYPYPGGITEPAKPQRDLLPLTAQPAGFEEFREAFSPSGKYGKWLRSLPAAIKIDRTLFLHAGLGEKYAEWSVDRINGEVSRELNDFTRLHGGIVTDPDGPLWYSGFSKPDDDKLNATVQGILKGFDVDRIVVGHTYAEGAVTPRANGKAILIDVGLSRVYDNVGKLAVLEIDGGTPYARHRGQKLKLPEGEAGMLDYLRQAAALDPQPSPLLPRIQKGK